MIEGGQTARSGLTKKQFTMVNDLRPQVQEIAGKEFPHFYPVGIRSKVVAGTNFFVKIQVSETEYIHAQVSRPLPHFNEEHLVTKVLLEKSQHYELLND